MKSDEDAEEGGTCDDSGGWQDTYQHKAFKRKTIGSPSLPKKQQKLNIIPNTSNRFAVLDTNTQSDDCNASNSRIEQDSATTESVFHKPPPIFIPQVNDINKMIISFSALIGRDNFTYKSGRDGQARVMASNSDSYRKLVSFLDANNIVFHTYQLKEDKPYKIVIKNIHFSTPLDDIKLDLAQNGHTVRNIVNARSKATKMPMSLFFVDLEPSANNKHVFDINRLCSAVVKIEPPRKFNNLAQCHRCQEFGHTKRYCKKPFRCVKCGLDHPTHLCEKNVNTPPKCVHCLQNHTANYKGCRVYQELVCKKDSIKTINNKPRPNVINSSNNEQHFLQNHVSYADVTKGQQSSTTFNLEKLEALISKQIELTTTLMTMMSSLLSKLCN